MKMQLSCDACGANQLVRRRGYYECEFCGSRYLIDEDEQVTGRLITDSQLVQKYFDAAKCMRSGDHTGELRILTEALALDQDNTTTLVKLGRCYRTLGFSDKALEIYQQALEIDPECGLAYTNTGTILLLRQDWHGGAAQYEKGLPLIDKTTNDYWTAYANYAVAVAKLGDPARAEAMVREAEQHGYANGAKVRAMAGLPGGSSGGNGSGGKQGCYIATCVYQSYDCPQVWTLRRFRDFRLAKSFWGRAFIRLYYAVSPTLVRLFGERKWFRGFWKQKLDRLVDDLQRRGYASTEYED